MSLRGPCGRKVPSLLLSYDRPKVWSFSLFICSSYIYTQYIYTTYICIYIYVHIHWEQLNATDQAKRNCAVTTLGPFFDAREFCNERPTKKRKSWLPARITFAQRKTWKRTSAGFVPKPLRNCSPKNLETLLLEPTKKTFGTHKKQSFGNRCRQLSRKACARCLWRSGSDRRTQRKKSHGGAPSSNTPPLDHNHKSCPSHTKLQGKPLRNVRLGSLQATRPNSRKRCLRRACEKAEPQQVFVPKPLRNRSRKNAETSLLEPTKNKET